MEITKKRFGSRVAIAVAAVVIAAAGLRDLISILFINRRFFRDPFVSHTHSPFRLISIRISRILFVENGKEKNFSIMNFAHIRRVNFKKLFKNEIYSFLSMEKSGIYVCMCIRNTAKYELKCESQQEPKKDVRGALTSIRH